MAGLDSINGLTILKYNEILKELNERTVEYFGYTVDTSADSVIGIYNSITSYQFAKLWELAQGIYDAQSLLASQGEALENNALLTGAVRKQPTQSFGTNWYIGDAGTVVKTGALIESVSGTQFQAPYDIIIEEGSCVEAKYTVSILLPDTDYRIRIDNNVYTYTTPNTVSAGTTLDILNYLSSAITGDGVATTSIYQDIDDVTLSYMVVSKVDKSVPFALNSTSYLVPSSIYTPELVVSVQNGSIIGDRYALNKILTPINGWEATLNPVDLNLGKELETDDEFRTRVLESYSASGSGTPDSIASRMRKITGVAACLVRDNKTFETNSDGIPAKSYEVVVEGGDVREIVQVIWNNQPAGIPTYGQEFSTLVDSAGQTQTVYFTRPTNLFGYINIDYTLYNEEEFPEDGLELMKEACVIFGDTLDIGEDVIPKRFASAIYDSVSGLDDVTVSITLQVDTNTEPDQSSYSASRIPVDSIQTTSFALGRIQTYKE